MNSNHALPTILYCTRGEKNAYQCLQTYIISYIIYELLCKDFWLWLGWLISRKFFEKCLLLRNYFKFLILLSCVKSLNTRIYMNNKQCNSCMEIIEQYVTQQPVLIIILRRYSNLVAPNSPPMRQITKKYSTSPWPEKEATCTVIVFNRLCQQLQSIIAHLGVSICCAELSFVFLD